MAYKIVPTAGALAKAKDFKKLATDLENLKKTKNVKKEQLVKPQKDLDVKGQEIKTLLVSEMGMVRQNYGVHAALIEQNKGASDLALKNARDGYNGYKTTPLQEYKNKIMSALNKCVILLEESEGADLAYGKAWSEYRSFNPISQGVEKKWTEDFSRLRSELMSDGKSVTLKIEQIRQNITQVEAVIKQVTVANVRDLTTARGEAKDLADKMANLLKELKDAKGSSKNSFETSMVGMQSWATNKSLKKEDFPTCESAYKNIINTVNTWKTKLKGMQTTFDNGKSEFSTVEAGDGQVKASLALAATSLKEADGLVKLGQVAIPQAATALQKLREKLGAK